MKDLDSIANAFFNVFYYKKWSGIDPASVEDLLIDEAYEVQNLVTQKRVKAGESVTGYKVGCTSPSIQTQFGINEPIYGRLFQPHIFRTDNKKVDWSEYINCAIEPEMVIKIKKDLSRTDISDEELIRSIDYVSPAIEIHNYKFWHRPPTIQELICSGGIHAGLIVGNTKIKADQLSFINEMFCVYKNGKLLTSEPASAIMGGPLHSLRWLINSLTKKGLYLKKDSFVIPGSPVELIEINTDTIIKIEIEKVGQASAVFEKN